ncbi:DinB family protein [Robertkochia flava]|uniref:DinB family protein n=1 Tax=Robertkochia flava TaxID=3447986 RepID=UPI001CCA9CA9|nr:DinB family protein [Robertkochia marina]
MNSTNSYLAARLREVYLDGRWIANTNYKEQLEGLSWEQATRKIGDLNSIAALVYHINYYLEGIMEVFEGGELTIKDQYSFDLPRLTSDAQWRQLVNTFLSNAGTFAEQVGNIPESQWSEPFVDEKYGDYLRNIEGVLEHSYYHLGQITLIRKMITPSH